MPSALHLLAGLICVQELQALKGDAVEKPKQIVQPSDLPVRESHSQVVAVTGGTLVFIAGMTSRSEKDATPVHPGDMRAQLRQVCENIGRALRSVGGDYSDAVKTPPSPPTWMNTTAAETNAASISRRLCRQAR